MMELLFRLCVSLGILQYLQEEFLNMVALNTLHFLRFLKDNKINQTALLS